VLEQSKFDLNIEKVLENWEIFHALREIIANALDEQILTKTKEIEIKRENDFVIIRDFGRGLEYQHLTQNENEEKINSPELVIGKFGVGLKDAFATLNRHGIVVRVKTKHGDLTLEKQKKHGFDDIITLHVLIDTESSESDFIGTEFSLSGCSEDDLSKAKNLFLIFSGEEVLEKVKFGEILTKKSPVSNIYIKGVRVAEEENFLFSYNITSLTTTMEKALNRERTHVGREAYRERIKSIILSSKDSVVAKHLVDDLGKYEEGTQHEELKYNDIIVHACKILNSKNKVVFVTPQEQSTEKHLLDYAKGDELEIITIPNIIKEKIQGIKDIEGNTMRDISQYRSEYNESFVFDFVPEDELTTSEKEVFSHKEKILNLIGGKPKVVKEIKISETLRVGSSVCGVAGMWDPSDQQIVIKRSELSDLRSFAGTLLHEIAHAKSGRPDIDKDFELELSDFLGQIVADKIKS
jgi:hypothetical protein